MEIRCATYLDAAKHISGRLKQRQVTLDDNHIIIVPDKFSLAAERYFMENLPQGGSFDVSVMTLNRLMLRICPTQSGYISTQGAAMAIKLIAAQNEKKLLCFSQSCQSPNFAADMQKTIARLKSCKVAPEQISGQNLPKSIEKNSLLYRKLNDISLIYSEYNKFLTEKNLKDASDRMELLINAVPQSDFIKNSYFYIFGFDSLTPQIKEVFKLLKQYSKEYVFTGVYQEDTEDDNEPVLDTVSNPFYKHLRQNLWKYPFQIYKERAPIIIYTALDRASMMDAAAQTIKEYIKKGCKYNQIALIGKLTKSDLEPLDEAKIPYNYDHKEPLAAHPLSRFVLCAFDAVVSGYYKGFLEISKNAFSGVDYDDAQSLHNYWLKYNVSGRVRESFETRDAEEERAECARNTIYNYLEPFERDCEAAKTIGDYIEAVKKLLCRIDAQKRCAEYSYPEEFAPFAKQAYDKFMACLAAAEVMADHSVKTAEFAQILSGGIAATEISAIPSLTDAVEIASADTFRLGEYEVIIYTDTAEGYFPSQDRDNGMLSDNDLENMGDFGKSIVPKTKQTNNLAKFDLVMSMFLGKNLVFLYPQNVCGIKLKKAFLLSQLEILFPSHETKDQEEELAAYRSETGLWKDLPLRVPASQKAVARLFYKEYNLARASLKETLNEPLSALQRAFGIPLPSYQDLPQYLNQTAELFFSNNRAGVTAFETYFSCPYKHFVSHGLRLKEQKIGGEADPALLGVVLHSFAQRFAVLAENLSEQDIVSTAEKIMDDIKSEYHESDWESIDALRSEAAALGKELCRQSALSDFKIINTEVEIGQNSQYPPLILNTPKGDIVICGKIDRIDKFEDYVRVIDYKSGKIKEGWEKVYYGLNVQLFAYMSAITKNGLKPAAVLYFPIENDYTKKASERFTMSGFLSDNMRLLYAADENLLVNNKSDIIPIKLKKDNSPDKYSENALLTDEEFSKALEYTTELLQKAAEEISSGYIDTAPAFKQNDFFACTYCNYQGICAPRQKKIRKLAKSASKNSVIYRLSPDLTYDDLAGEDNNE